METNTQNTVVMIFQHVEIFFSMLDHHADHRKNIVGFKISSYEGVVGEYLNRCITAKTDRHRIQSALTIENMQACGLLAFVNDSRGQFALQRHLLQMIQSIESKRIRELGQPDLDVIYAQVRSLYDYFMPKGGAYNPHDPDFQENLSTLLDTLQDILGKIDHNVRALEGSSKRLSEILESHDFNSLVMTDQVRNALDEVIRISKRNILPTLIFLNEKGMAADASAMHLIRRIKEQFERTAHYNELANITAIEMKLLSYSEVVKEIRTRLYHYVDMDQKQRILYNNIETRFNDLLSNVISRLDTKLTGKKLPPDDPVFIPGRIFRGLNNWNMSSLTGMPIHLPATIDSRYVTEYIRGKLKLADVLASRKRAPTPRVESAADSLKRKQRVLRVKGVMITFNAQSENDDLYQAIHSHLNNNLDDYRLRDIYDAIHFVDKKYLVKPTLKGSKISHDGQTLSYKARRLEAVAGE